ncbi:5'-nucleotidase /3'-nucleotidase /exopolyphosphatase [Geoalkalibacter ferrihydriticus]|uniref:5'-nucleotidase SurE n=2 Tax=Geoalkalibacter ferrihydriticus TaxID=392333 RepID=A0A0C2HK06_9BACT|nr:5'/3'-nucleotidase SurE [Geoalkalibacter ferrihydriticus]KIH77401.1 stationary phase survival protein SurE [Geoalkalibacter ferrihydriticus DSM 17813]SDM16602.1 5'-nucleotidase /3'-nucleotidase /exopolyphosphatase [Geoalkalibacter ferrihydriticus]
MFILITNDDGIHAPGLVALAQELSELGRIVVVAPDRERSATGHSLTLHSPLRAEEVRPHWFAIDGTPTDCVNLGIHGLFRERPALVVSGINRGANMGDDITYSGTVAAAMEATLMGVPAFAVSLALTHGCSEDYRPAARIAARLARTLMTHGLPTDTFFNVNIPPVDDAQIQGIRLTRQGKRIYGDLVIENTDPRGRKYYWIGAGDLDFKDVDGTDFHAVHRGYVSLTPLHLDLTNYRSFDELSRWDIFSSQS